jgi:flagellar hook-associated protein 2
MAISNSTSTPALSSHGVGSGLDVAGLVAKLMAVERQPLTALERREAAYQSTISAFGTIKGALSALQTAIKTLADRATFKTLSATSGDTSVFSASAGDGAVAGAYSIEVTQLAQAQKLVSNGFASTSDSVGTGTLTFDFGSVVGSAFTSNGAGARTVAIASGQQTLAGIRDAVNAAGIGVTATIVNDGSATGNRLVFTSSNSGAANSMRISVADDDGNNVDASGLSALAFDPAASVGSGRNMVEKIGAKDAALIVDGIAITRPTNTVNDAIQGVTLNLVKTNIGVPTTLTVAADSTAAMQAVKNFVAAYNNLHTTLGNLTKYDATSKTGSVLTGDGTVRLIQNQLRAVIGNAVSGLSSDLDALSQVGVSFQSDGSLALDNGKLTAAVNANRSGVGDLLTSIGSKLNDALTPMLNTGGMLAARTDGLNSQIKRIDDQKTRLEARLNAVEAQYNRQFSALDSLLGSMQQTSTFLTQQLANLPTPGKSSK